ncbi:ATP-dependent helicase [Candidatus Woesearchaeota archaeon]|nr:ATP-dependent helicase [Candidatus Woesearchaeota archaeon]
MKKLAKKDIKNDGIDLNNEQKEAINTIDGNLLIIASAGTGKTTTIVERYVNLILNHSVNPGSVMITTFTNKAAKDMLKKINQRTNKTPKYIGTMHSLFLKILRDNSELIKINPNFTLLTEENDKKSIIKDILNKKGVEPTSKNIFYFIKRIGMFKNRGINHEDLDEKINLNNENSEPEELREGEFAFISPKIKNLRNYVYKKYQERLKELCMLDFDDILLYTYVLFEKNNGLRNEYKEKLKYIMVDEAQDINLVQRRILELLQNENLCLIGDDCQNIYTWRGTSNDLIFTFDSKHKKIILKDNYRSSRKIIDNVNNIISSIAFKIDKSLNCTRNEGTDVMVREFYDFYKEKYFLANEVKILLENGENAENIAILFRTNNIGKQIEREFRKYKIPCHLSRAKGFFEREEIKDVLSFLKLKINPFSVLEFERILKMIPGIGTSKIESLKEISKKNKISILESLNHIDKLKVNIEVKTKLYNLRKILIDSKQNPVQSFLSFFDYWRILEKKYSSDPERIEDKRENIGVLTELFQDYNFNKDGVMNFLDSLIEMEKKEKEDNKVILSTIHSAKGLEWKHVYIAGCNEGILPFYYIGELTKTKRDDELRLFYVAVSRAKDFLTITYSLNNGFREAEPSQFIDIIEGDFEYEK